MDHLATAVIQLLCNMFFHLIERTLNPFHVKFLPLFVLIESPDKFSSVSFIQADSCGV